MIIKKTRKPRRLPPGLHEKEPGGRIARAQILDRLADHELQAGFHARAERLAHQAEALRETAP